MRSSNGRLAGARRGDTRFLSRIALLARRYRFRRRWIAPPLYARQVRVQIILFAVLFLLIPTLLRAWPDSSNVAFGVDAERMRYVLGAMFQVMWYIEFIWFGFFWKSRLSRRLGACGGAMCVSCGYVLIGLPTRGECPECGHRYRTGTTKHMWRRWFFYSVDESAARSQERDAR